MSIVTVGIDLAENVFAVHGVDDNGKSVLVKPKVARGQRLRAAVTDPVILMLSRCQVKTGDLAEPLQFLRHLTAALPHSTFVRRATILDAIS